MIYKLHAIRSTVGDYKQKTCLSRRDTVLLNRLRIGHTRLSHSYQLSGDDLPENQPECVSLLMGTDKCHIQDLNVVLVSAH